VNAFRHVVRLPTPARYVYMIELSHGPINSEQGPLDTAGRTRNVRDDLLTDLASEMAALTELVAATADLSVATPAEGWDIRDVVSHLLFIDTESTFALTEPAAFTAAAAAKRGNPDFIGGHLTAGRDLGVGLLPRWRHEQARLLSALADTPADTRVPWFGPPMSSASMATARLMEYWAHGRDVTDALGIRSDASPRLRHIARLGFRTRDWSYVVRGLTAPDVDIAVRLEQPDGTVLSFGEPTASERVTGTTEDFCLVVTQRRHVYDTELVIDGAAALDWMLKAQCYAGVPGSGRPSRRRAGEPVKG
jgi:uncharacterized protein (TIGR03084 family)